MKNKSTQLFEKHIPCPVEDISGVWRFERQGGQHSVARSTPGHLLHCLIKGNTDLKTNGRSYKISPFSIIYYHEAEEVKNYFIDDIVFYSVAFKASGISPLPLSRRVFKVESGIVEIFREMYDVYTTNNSDSSMRLYSLLLSLLPRLGFSAVNHDKLYTGHEKLWFEVESWVRKNRRFRAGIPELSHQFRVSAATLYRACREASATSVSKRLQQMRMEEAKALLLFSGLNITETAEYLGYPRMHEFSREFSAYFKHPASNLTCKI